MRTRAAGVGLAIAGIMTVTLTAGSAETMQAERPTFEEGYTLTFRNPATGAVWALKYIGKEDGLLVFEGSNPGNPRTAKWYYTEDLNLVRSKGRRYEIENDPHNGGHNFPFFLGKKWEHRFVNTTGREVTHRTVWAEVKAYEQVTVPVPAYETFWYAPDVKFQVKYYSREFQNEAELVKYGK